jgi:hypothetical protein
MTESAEAAYASQMGGSSVSANITVLSPGALQQITSAISQINGLIKENYPNAGPVTANDALNVTVGNGTGALTPPQELGLPNGIEQSATIAQALDQLATSSIGGVAAGASSLLDRLIPSADGKSAGWTDTEAEDVSLNANGTTAGIAEFAVSTMRDDLIYAVAQDMVNGASLSEGDQNRIGEFLSNTYNGSFTVVKLSSLAQDGENPMNTMNVGNLYTVAAPDSSGNMATWAIVLPQDKANVTVSASSTSTTMAA